jgi:hypothetical protein
MRRQKKTGEKDFFSSVLDATEAAEVKKTLKFSLTICLR